jgi:molecular chaperone DnaJ
VATLYELLDVDPGATTAEVRAAYLVKARALHPDRHGGDSPAEMAVAQRRMQEVNAAWTVLSDPRGRREYDETLRVDDSAVLCVRPAA